MRLCPALPTLLLLLLLLLAACSTTQAALKGGGGGAQASVEVHPHAATSPASSFMAGYEWHNWHDTVQCHPAFLAYPSTVDEVVALVRGHSKVRVVGLGHSFNPLTCSADLMLSTRQLNHIGPLDPLHKTVTTQAGVKTRNLIDWLAHRGYALATIPFYIDQTIGGVVATASHGSSIKLGSVSSLVRAMTLVLADGSLKTLTAADGDLFTAGLANVGELGVVVELTLAVVPNDKVLRELHYLDDDGLLAELQHARINALAVDRVHYWYSPPLSTAAKTCVLDLPAHTQAKVKAQRNVGRDVSDLYFRTIANSSFEKPLRRLFMSRYMKHPNAQVAASYVLLGHTLALLPGTYTLSDALPTQTELETEVLRTVYGRYDQFEFGVALDKAHDCVKSLFELFDRNVTNRDDFRVPFCMRYVGAADDGLLAMSHGGARFYLNMDNYDVYNRGGFSQSFQVIKDLMMSPTCEARVHYGKASVHSPVGGTWGPADAQYVVDTVGLPTFERFKTVAKILDPTGKFADGLLIH